MPHLEATNHFVGVRCAERYYADNGCDKAEVARKLRDNEIVIGEPPERPGAIRVAPKGHFHYQIPEEIPTAMRESELRRYVGEPKRSFTPVNGSKERCADCGVAPGGNHKHDCEGGLHDLKDPSDTPVIAFIRSCTLDGLTLKVPSERIEAKVYAEAKKALLIFGGKWNTGKQCFTFKKDPSANIATLLGTGEVVNVKKNRQAFFTPAEVVDTVLDVACIDSHHHVLEPSAGAGAISEECLRFTRHVTCVELDADDAADLEATGYYEAVHCTDFMKFDTTQKFDRIVMNPPFTKGQYHRHVAHALRFLSKSGRLVAVVPDNTCPKLEAMGAEVVGILEAGTFAESGTSVATRIIQILS